VARRYMVADSLKQAQARNVTTEEVEEEHVLVEQIVA